MKRIMKKLMCLWLAVLFLTAYMPSIAASADENPTQIFAGEVGLDWADILIECTQEHEGYRVEKSTDSVRWTTLEDDWYDDNYYADLAAKKATYFRVTPFEITYDEDSWDAQYIYGQPSNVLRVLPNVSAAVYEDDAYVDAGAGKAELHWNVYAENKRYITGFYIYASVNNGDFSLLKSVSAKKFKEQSENGCYSYSVKLKSLSKNGYYVCFKIVPYFWYDDQRYYDETQGVIAQGTYLADDFLRVTTKKDAVVLKWNKLDGAKYCVTYTKYRLSTGEPVGEGKTKKTSKTKYTIKNTNAKKYGYYLTVSPYWGSVYSENWVTVDTHSGLPLMRGADKSNKKTIKVLGTRQKKTTTAWTYTLSKKDRATLKKFCNKHFKGKKMSRAEKAEYTLNWINKHVDYAYDDLYAKISSTSYVDAIFNRKLGQCLQYNGAYAAFLTYLGYEARVIEGYRRGGINHYWCEVKVHGRWYLCETGNYGKNGDWMYFCCRYADAGGYMKNGKDAKD